MSKNTLTVAQGQKVSPLKWYEYSQNNSGGWFDIRPSEGIGASVWVQARNYEEANRRAEQIGLYWDGADEDGPDCSCCGDRWYEKWSEDGVTREPYIWAEWREDSVFAHRYDGTFYQVTSLGEVE
jgi:hypothetical protein